MVKKNLEPNSPPKGLKWAVKPSILWTMSTVQEIESAIAKLPVQDMEVVRDWLNEFIENQLEVSDKFKTKIERAKQEIASGVYSRTRQPGMGR
jgi:hypothetical protein